MPVWRFLTSIPSWLRGPPEQRYLASPGRSAPDVPASTEPERARHEAAAAVAICHGCPVRAQCLSVSLRYWDIGQHGVRGGLVPAERATLRNRILARPPRAASIFAADGVSPCHRRQPRVSELAGNGRPSREIADLVDDPSTDAVAHLRRLRGLLLEQRDGPTPW